MSIFHWQFLITYIFTAPQKFGECYITGQWGEFRVNNATLCLHFLFWYCFCCFSSRNLCFYNFHFIFWWSIKFPLQNINQSETRIGDKKLSEELYSNKKNRPGCVYIIYLATTRVKFQQKKKRPRLVERSFLLCKWT